ncbi:hypothetical protein Patl1_32605 [Pistacia atlantica]|uniref:Uncharacterized protein n=1 Tax=Pistacia atlantica TaxID=434234 RepID=A0ACC1AMT5_9ROSI|nr:hypothetical protein Patl1_32605 [Pistacia atlantica]
MLPLCLIVLVFFLSLSGSLNALMTNVAVEVQPLSPGPGHLTGSLTGPGLKTLAGWQSPTTPLASLGRSEVIKLVEINRVRKSIDEPADVRVENVPQFNNGARAGFPMWLKKPSALTKAWNWLSSLLFFSFLRITRALSVNAKELCYSCT